MRRPFDCRPPTNSRRDPFKASPTHHNDYDPCVDPLDLRESGRLTRCPLCAGLFAKGRVTGFKRGKRNQRVHTSLVQIEGVANKEEAQFYLGKVGYFDCVGRSARAGSCDGELWSRRQARTGGSTSDGRQSWLAEGSRMKCWRILERRRLPGNPTRTNPSLSRQISTPPRLASLRPPSTLRAMTLRPNCNQSAVQMSEC